jgi:hypothetical protein
VSIRLDTSLPRFYAQGIHDPRHLGPCLRRYQWGPVGRLPNTRSRRFTRPHSRFPWPSIRRTPIRKISLRIAGRTSPASKERWGMVGMDYIEFRAFFDCLLAKKPLPIDVYDMATWMAITPLSEESIRKGGAPIAMPDFTSGEYKKRPSEDVMPLPGRSH